MTFYRSFRATAGVAAVVCLLWTMGSASGAVQTTAGLPAEISDAEFWRMIVEFSEPGGTYPYENFVSNEINLQEVIPALKATTTPGGVFLGVGPEQNFTYVSALQSKLAFVIDIRRQNMLELLLYKALFEMSSDRVDFVGKLFSRPRPEGLDTRTSPAALFTAYEKVRPDADLQLKNLQAIKGTLAQHGIQLSSEDLTKIDYVYQTFYRAGPGINYEFASATPSSLSNPPSYSKLMNATDTTGKNWGFLANEENYKYVRELQRKNLIVPLVGDFAGPAVIRNIGRYLNERKITVQAFYTSNVEYYLNAAQRQQFYASVATLPVDPSSMLIRFILGGQSNLLPWMTRSANVSVISPMLDLTGPVLAGRRVTFEEMVRATKDPNVIAGRSRGADIANVPTPPAISLNSNFIKGLSRGGPDLGSGPLVYVPKGSTAPAGYTLIGTTDQTIRLANGGSATVELDVYSRK